MQSQILHKGSCIHRKIQGRIREGIGGSWKLNNFRGEITRLNTGTQLVGSQVRQLCSHPSSFVAPGSLIPSALQLAQEVRGVTLVAPSAEQVVFLVAAGPPEYLIGSIPTVDQAN